MSKLDVSIVSSLHSPIILRKQYMYNSLICCTNTRIEPQIVNSLSLAQFNFFNLSQHIRTNAMNLFLPFFIHCISVSVSPLFLWILRSSPNYSTGLSIGSNFDIKVKNHMSEANRPSKNLKI